MLSLSPSPSETLTVKEQTLLREICLAFILRDEVIPPYEHGDLFKNEIRRLVDEEMSKVRVTLLRNVIITCEAALRRIFHLEEMYLVARARSHARRTLERR